MPLIAFAFLFGLSMDYEVFILTRIREERDRTGSTSTAIIEGIGRTGRLVTGAALILFLAFAALSTGPETDLKVMATALGAGILLDATIVRALLVPALVAVLGKWNWWLPGWATRLLRIPVQAAEATPSIQSDAAGPAGPLTRPCMHPGIPAGDAKAPAAARRRGSLRSHHHLAASGWRAQTMALTRCVTAQRHRADVHDCHVGESVRGQPPCQH